VPAAIQDRVHAMLALDDKEDPNFSDADYQLAAYAAALRVITRHGNIEDIDVAYELSRERSKGEESPLALVIKDAVRTASNYLVPPGLPEHLWKRLGPEEKLYPKGLEVEGHGELRSGVSQEFARSFGVWDYPSCSARARPTRPGSRPPPSSRAKSSATAPSATA
jgi:hypothetical protein